MSASSYVDEAVRTAERIALGNALERSHRRHCPLVSGNVRKAFGGRARKRLSVAQVRMGYHVAGGAFDRQLAQEAEFRPIILTANGLPRWEKRRRGGERAPVMPARTNEELDADLGAGLLSQTESPFAVVGRSHHPAQPLVERSDSRRTGRGGQSIEDQRRHAGRNRAKWW